MLRVVIMGACGRVGRSFVRPFAPSAQLILSDLNGPMLRKLSCAFNATGIFCDVASKTSVQAFAQQVLSHWPEFDVLINAAGRGYERTLGMYRVCRALMPGLRRGTAPRWIINVPPCATDLPSEIFPYASSDEAFTRLTESVAQEVQGSNVSVGIACPFTKTLEYVGGWSPQSCDRCEPGADTNELAGKVSELILSSRPSF